MMVSVMNYNSKVQILYSYMHLFVVGRSSIFEVLSIFLHISWLLKVEHLLVDNQCTSEDEQISEVWSYHIVY